MRLGNLLYSKLYCTFLVVCFSYIPRNLRIVFGKTPQIFANFAVLIFLIFFSCLPRNQSQNLNGFRDETFFTGLYPSFSPAQELRPLLFFLPFYPSIKYQFPSHLNVCCKTFTLGRSFVFFDIRLYRFIF